MKSRLYPVGFLLCIVGLITAQLTGVLDLSGHYARISGLVFDAEEDHKHAKGGYWTCSMHPSVRLSENEKCPICGMDLVYVGGSEGDSTGQSERAVSGKQFWVDPSRQQLINLRTVPVEKVKLDRTIDAVGILQLDETGYHHVHTKIAGWVAEVYVNSIHQRVEKGEPLFTLYSPDMVSSQEEYLLAIRTASDLSSSPFENVSAGSRTLVEASKRRLMLFDFTEEQLRELEETRAPKKNATVYSPAAGHVLEREVFPNLWVSPEMDLYTIADHTRIWAQLEVYESEIGSVREGQRVQLTTEVYPGRTFNGVVRFVYPHLDAATRTQKVRVELPNPNFELKPEMFVKGQLRIPGKSALAIPSDAVIRTGVRDIVYIDQGDGHLELREVLLGSRGGEFYEVLSGLSEGERVVSAANFLIDSESKIQGLQNSWETAPGPQTNR